MTAPPPSHDRRQFHRAALALALAPWTAACGVPRTVAAPRWPADPFSLGVASGMPGPTTVLLWTRLFPGFDAEIPASQQEGLQVRYEIYSDEALRQPVRQGQVRTDADRAFSVHVAVDGLAPGRPYWYRFRCGDAVSPVGRTRTAPAADAAVDHLRLALASCQHYEQGHFTVLREVAQRDLDLVLFVGDYIYETNSSSPDFPRRHRGPVPYTLAQYRDRHAFYKLDPDLRAAHAAHPWLLMWDDHEVVNDYTDDLDPFDTPPEVFLKRRAAAYRAYFEHLPLPLPALAAATGPDADWTRVPLHARHAWGQLADLWTLDCRQYRSAHACPAPGRRSARQVTGCAELADPARTMLGTAQERWLAEGLSGARGRWKLLAQATQIAPSRVPARNPADGLATFTGAWDGYPEARRRLLQTVADTRQTNVVTLGGDVHHHLAAQLRVRPNDTASPVVASEFVTSAVTSRGLGQGTLATIRAANPDIAHASGEGRGYVQMDVTPAEVRGTFRATAWPVAADARIETQAVFTVANGRAGVERA